MNKFRFTLNVIAIAIFTFAFASLAQAQATRTWVSGVGDDVNPCSRTAPCKTFAGAISKTAAGGEIDALDPGGYGAVTITKSITIDGGGTLASILSSGVNGIIINDSAANTIVVTIRRLSINGAGTTLGINGIRIVSALKVNVQDCKIFNYAQNGILDERTNASARLSVINCVIHNVTLDGIHIGGAGVSNTQAQIDGCTMTSANQNGIFVKGNAGASISNTQVANSNGAGVQTDNGAVAILTRVVLTFNNIGLSNTGGATRLSECTITNNTTGVNISAGSVTGFSNNVIDGNGGGNTISSSLLPK